MNFSGTDQGESSNANAYFLEAFARNIGLLTLKDQAVLRNARVAIPGLGGVGGGHLIAMVRSGIGKFNIADADVFEPVNINRQFGATLNSFGRPKLEVMQEQALAINPYLEISTFSEGVTRENVDAFLHEVDVVVDGLDFFSFDIRRLLFNKAREKGIYVVTAAPLGYSSALLVFSPFSGMSFDNYFNIVHGMEEEEQYLAFAMGLAPRPTHIFYMDMKTVSFESKKGPSLGVSCMTCVGIAGAVVLKIILKKGKVKPVPHYIQFDPYLMKLRRGKLHFGSRNPIHRLKSHFARFLLKRNNQMYFLPQPPTPEVSVTARVLTKPVQDFLLQAGTRAPSGDNAQPWKFTSAKDSIEVHLDRAADTSLFNVNQIASIISCGAVIENIKVAASHLDLQTMVKLLPDHTREDLVAGLSFSRVNEGERGSWDSLMPAVWERNTNRKPYSRSPVSPEIIERVKASISEFSDVNLHIISGKRKIREMAEIIYVVDKIRCNNKRLHEYFHGMIRYAEPEILEKRDGFPLKNLEAGVAGEIFLRATKSWKVMRLLNKVGFSKMVALHSYQCIKHSAGVALLTVDGRDNQSFLTGGRALQRVWLTLTRWGVSVQPMTAITLFGVRWMGQGRDQFSAAEQKVFTKVWQNFQKLYPLLDFTSSTPVILLRFGYSQPMTTGTLRKDIKQFMAESQEEAQL